MPAKLNPQDRYGRLWAAAAQVMLHRGLIKEGDPGPGVVEAWINGLTRTQRRKLEKIAASLIGPDVETIH